MSFALNEIEATAKKAARGAGYDWGLAEEASKATRWLCARGLPGAEALAGLLDAGLAADLARHRPGSLSGPWSGADTLCPLITGAALSDMADTLALPLEIAELTRPLLLLPFAAAAARRTGFSLVLDIAGARAATDGRGLHLAGDLPDRAPVTLTAGPVPGPILPRQSRATPDPAAWATLNAYARHTYAPATEASRLKGAGAGLSDND